MSSNYGADVGGYGADVGGYGADIGGYGADVGGYAKEPAYVIPRSTYGDDATTGAAGYSMDGAAGAAGCGMDGAGYNSYTMDQGPFAPSPMGSKAYGGAYGAY